MRLGVRLVVALRATAVLSRCDNPDCTALARYAVHANIIDSITAAPLGYRASLIIRDGSYVDSVSSSENAADSARTHYLAAGLEREGIYQVTVRREGSRVWTRTDIRVPRESRCRSIETADLTVRLQPAR